VFPNNIIDSVLEDTDEQNLYSLPDGISAVIASVTWEELDLSLKIYKFKEKEVQKFFEREGSFFLQLTIRFTYLGNVFRFC